jgi:glycosyltransferase involved in cell wall biosynthesis
MQTQSPHSANGAKRLQPVSNCASGSVAPRVLPGHFRHARVALLSTWHPEPVDNGRKQRTRIIIDALARQHEIILISLVEPGTAAGDSLPAVPGVTAQFQLPLPVFRSMSLPGVIGAFSRLPRSIVSTWSPATAHELNRILTEHDVTAAIGTDLRTLRYLINLPPGIARILDEPDVSPFTTSASTRKGSLRARLRELKYRHFLGTSRGKLDAVTVASEFEVQAFGSLSGGPSGVIANVVPDLPADLWSPTRDDTLLYTGALTYRPNLKAVEFLAQDILRTIASEYPGLQLIVTGTVPEPRPAVAESPFVTLTGRVPSLDSYYRESRLFVVPLQAGTGTRIKLLEAMSYGMPIVSTRKGAEGLPVIDGTHMLLADSTHDIISAIRLLLEDQNLSMRLGANARQLVEERLTASATETLWHQLIAAATEYEAKRIGNG